MTMLLILWISAVVSSFLDNIPFVATLIPMIMTIQSHGVDVTLYGGHSLSVLVSVEMVLWSVLQPT